MVDVRVRVPVAPGDPELVRQLADAAEAVDGHPPVGDAVWRDLDQPGPDTALLLAYDEERPVGALHLTRTEDGAPRFTLAVVVDPAHRQSGVARELVARAIDLVRERGGGNIELWAFGADTRADAFAQAEGFTLERELLQLRVGLPLGEEPRWPPGVGVRTFDPGRDQDEWVAVNNRAFRGDPDQGGWTVKTLRRRENEPWFDPSAFLLAHDDRGLAGFCWTKVHPATPPYEPAALGEIYVIGVDPDRQGSGLGRALVVAGLESLAGRGIDTGMLFVDAANEPAVRLYQTLGFEMSRADRAYARIVS